MRLGAGLTVMLALIGVSVLLPAFAGPWLIILPTLALVGALIAVAPHIVTAIIGGLISGRKPTHGRYTRTAIQRRREVRAILRALRALTDTR